MVDAMMRSWSFDTPSALPCFFILRAKCRNQYEKHINYKTQSETSNFIRRCSGWARVPRAHTKKNHQRQAAENGEQCKNAAAQAPMQTLCKHCTNFVPRLHKHCPNIGQILSKHCRHIAQTLHKTLIKHSSNIKQTFYSRCTNIGQALSKHRTNIRHTFAQTVRKPCTNIVQILLNMHTTLHEHKVQMM